MRTDATIDRCFVRCPHASTLAYGKWRAQVGDWVYWTYPEGHSCIGRMIGRVHHAPTLGESPEIHDWIEVLQLGEHLTHAFPRWVNPEWVSQVHPAAPDIARFLAWFAGPDLPVHDRARCLGLSQYGALSANQQADYPHWDFAGKLEQYEKSCTRARAEV